MKFKTTKLIRHSPIILFLLVNCMVSKYSGNIPRLDEKSQNKSIQIVKIAEQLRFSHYQTVAGEARMVYTQEDLIKGIQIYKEQYSNSKPKWEYANQEQYQFEKRIWIR